MIVLYGIPNCDTVKKARAWLAQHGVAYVFHDFKKDGLPAQRLDAWVGQVGWEALLNRRGGTWRKLDDAAQQRVTGAVAAKAVMHAQPSIIKRPVVEWSDKITVGFDPAEWALLASR